MKTISLIMSAYNEEKTVGLVLKQIIDLDYIDEIVVVDNGSTDNTYNVLIESKDADNRIKLFRNEKNIGLGAGLSLAIKNTKGDIIVRQDADLEYDPTELITLIDPIKKGIADVVYGSRMLVRKAHKVHYYYSYLANILITHISNLSTNLMLSDVETAAKAFDGKVLRSLKIFSKGFEIENEITVKLKKQGCRFYEVPYSYYGRSFDEGKKIRAIDGFKAILYTLYYSFIDKGLGLPKILDIALFYLIISFFSIHYLIVGSFTYIFQQLLSYYFRNKYDFGIKDKNSKVGTNNFLFYFIFGISVSIISLFCLVDYFQVVVLYSKIISILVTDIALFVYSSRKYI